MPTMARLNAPHSGDLYRPEIRWVVRDSLIVVVSLVLLAAQQLLSALSGHPDDIVGAETAVAFAILLTVVRLLILRGRSNEALGGLGTVILLANLVLPLVNSGFLVWTAILPVAAIVIAIPFLARRLLRPFAVAAWLDAVLATLLAASGGKIDEGPESPLGWTVGVTLTVLVVAVLVVRLEEHRRDLIESTITANATLQSANAEIARSRSTFELLFEETPLPTWVVDLETGRFMTVNRAAVEAYGWSREEFLGLTVDAITVVDADPDGGALARTTGPGAGPGPHRHLWKDGSIRTIELAADDLTFEGRAARLVTVVDVTDRVRAELDHDLLSLSADIVLIGDVSDRRLRAHQAVAGSLGLDLEAFRKANGLDLVHPEDRGATMDAYRRVREGERIWNFVNRMRDQGGTYHWLSWRIVLDRDQGRIIAVGHDITSLRQLEERLLHSERMRGIGQLAGGIAHDFNNLVTAIRGHADLALADLSDAAATRADLEVIRSAADRARALTGQLLLFSRRDAPRPERTTMEHAIAGLIPMLRRLIGEDIELRVEAAPEEAPILADPSQLDQVLVNLVVNARDAMPAGGTVTLRTRWAPGAESPNGRFAAVLEIQDSGTGISDEVRAHLFEPFFTTKPAGTGVGLGLASVDGIVRAAGGRIEVDSTPGAGTTFRIFWPCAPADPEHAPADAAVHAQVPVPAEPPPASPGTDVTPQVILVVEDDPSVRAFAARVLGRAGYRILSASDPAAARAVMAAEGGVVDLLFSDVVMPGGNGYDLAAELVAARPTLAVLLASGYDERRVTTSEVLRFPLLPKPYGPQELIDRVRQVLDARP